MLALGYFVDLWLTHLHLPPMGLDTSFRVEWALSFQDPLMLTAVASSLLLFAGHLIGGVSAAFVARTLSSVSAKRTFSVLCLTGFGGAVALASTTALVHAGCFTHVTTLGIDVFGILCFSGVCLVENKAEPSLRKPALELLLVGTIAGASLMAQGEGWTSYLAATFSFLMFIRLNQIVREIWLADQVPLERSEQAATDDGKDLL